MAKQSLLEATGESQPQGRGPSYHPTRFAVANRMLDVVDELTGGRAGWAQRLFSYLFIGGTAAVVNLVCLTLMLNVVLPPAHTTFDRRWHFVLASAVAYEVSILANFIPNDYFTFRFLSGHQRSWLARCARFHLTALGGVAVTFLISGSLYDLLHLNPTLAQAIALVIAVFFNFAFHHIFTYRTVGHERGYPGPA